MMYTKSCLLLSLVIPLLIGWLFGGRVIRWLKQWQKKGQPIREFGPQTHVISKQGTPTLGGLLLALCFLPPAIILLSVYGAWSIEALACLIIFCSFGVIGFIDDYLKIKQQSHKGIKGRWRLLIEFAISLMVMIVVEYHQKRHGVTVPMVGFLTLPSTLMVIVQAFIITGSANAYNLTDGLDGLAGGVSLMVGACLLFLCFSLLQYSGDFTAQAWYLSLMIMFIGSLIGFLWFNQYPAKLFMGDTGSLAIGGFLAIFACVNHLIIAFAIISVIPVIETLSVIIQVGSYRYRGGKRVFKMAPIHHHFEQLGWHEVTVTQRFLMITGVLCFIVSIIVGQYY